MPKKISNEQFKDRIKEVHGNKYELCDNYVKTHFKVKMKCHLHGYFYITPSALIHGKNGCMLCGKIKTIQSNTLPESIFYEKIELILPEHISLDTFQYTNATTASVCICKHHGHFLKSPQKLLNGKFCSVCTNVLKNRINRGDNEYFLKKMKSLNLTKYDLSHFEYLNNSTKSIAICKKHGNFLISAANLYKGKGCSICAEESRSNKRKERGKKNFLQKIDNIIRNRGNILGFTYHTMHIKSYATCNKHGDFLITPHKLLQGRWCRTCGFESMKEKQKMSINNFINKSNKVHNNFYDYNDTILINTKTKVKITCPIHGIFEQEPEIHLIGSGCGKCKFSKGENVIMVFLDKKSIFYEYQKKFNGCKYKRGLKFDFYVEEQNLCIEYDGQQHFRPISFNGIIEEKAKINFKRTKINDKIKTQYCIDNNIELLRIPYTEFKNIETILTDKLINGKTPLINYPIIKHI